MRFGPGRQARKQISLRLVTPELAQTTELLVGFDAFGDRPEVEVGGQVDDSGDDAFVRFVLPDPLHECLIDLDEAQRQTAQVSQ